MLRYLAFVGLIALASCSGGDTVYAQTAVVPPGNVQVLPIYTVLEPFILAAFGAVFSALLAWGLAILQRRTGITVQADARAQLQQAATNGAGRILAQAEGPLANVSFPIGSPAIAAEIPKVAEKVADAIQTLGYTPEVVQQKVGDLIQAKLGLAQASSAPTVAPVVVIPPAGGPQ